MSFIRQFLERADKKAYLVVNVFVLLIGTVDLVLLFLAAPADIHRIEPKHLALTYAANIVLATAGVGVQIWLNDKPKFKFLRLIAYAFTLAIFVSIGLVTLTVMKASRL